LCFIFDSCFHEDQDSSKGFENEKVHILHKRLVLSGLVAHQRIVGVVFLVDVLWLLWALVGPRAAEIVRVLVFVGGTLVFALHQLQLGNDRGLVDGCFDSLVVVDQGPKDSSCVSLDLGVLVVRAQKGEQARQEIVILEEVDLVLSAVQGGVPDEQQDRADELI